MKLATRQVADGQEKLLNPLDWPGLWFGDYAVYAGVDSTGSIAADTAVTTLASTVREFERIVQEEPGYCRPLADLPLERYANLCRCPGESYGLAPEDWLRTGLGDLAAVMRRDNPAADAGVVTLSQA